MPGFLVSDHYKSETVTVADIRISAMTLGFTLGFGLLTCVKAAIRTKTAWNRSRRATIYIFMVWGEVAVSLIFGLLGWLDIEGIVEPRQAWFSGCFPRSSRMLTAR